MSPEGYQGNTFAYWRALQMSRSIYLENQYDNKVTEKPALAVLKYHTKIEGKSKEFEVKFGRQESGALNATISDIFTDATTSNKDETFREEHIIHWGWFWNTKVSDMSVDQKSALIDRLAKMTIYYIQHGNIYLY